MRRSKSDVKVVNGVDAITNYWSAFQKYFWVIFCIKVLVKAVLWQNGETLAFPALTDPLIVMLLQFIPIVAMMVVMGYYSYKLSGKKLAWLYGVFGFLWFGVVAIFIGYFLVRRLKDKKIKELEPKMST